VQAVKPLYGRRFLFACGVNGGASRTYLVFGQPGFGQRAPATKTTTLWKTPSALG
jgi:hypothetical protein